MVRPRASNNNAVAKACPAVPCPHHPNILVSRYGRVATSLFSDRAVRVHAFTRPPGPLCNQSASMAACDMNRVGCAAIRDYSHTAAASAQRESKSKAKGRAKDGAIISQRANRIVNGVSTEEKKGQLLSKVQPRTLRLQNRFRTEHALYTGKWRLGDWFWWATRRSKCQNTVRTRQWRNRTRLPSTTGHLRCKPWHPIQRWRQNKTHSGASSVSAAARRVIHSGEDGDAGLTHNKKNSNNESGWCVDALSIVESGGCDL